MPSMSSSPVTADELLRLPSGRRRYELVRGALRSMSPAGWRHGRIALRFGRMLGAHVDAHGLGAAFAAETGFLLARNPDTVLAPDASFVRQERLQHAAPRGYFPGPPDLAVEVRSPDDAPASLRAKAEAWLAHGCPLVVTIDPDAHTATVYRPGAVPLHLTERDRLVVSDVLPGLALPLAELFAP